MNNKPIAIGNEDFKDVIKSGSLYVDKTLFIKDLIDSNSKALCFPRPRRFGKSLNMSMLNYYFNLEYKGNNLFNGLKIMNEGEKYLNEANKYPVIFLSFRELKTSTYSNFINEYKKVIGKLYIKYEFLLQSEKISDSLKNVFNDYYYMRTNNLTSAISDLMLMLNQHYNSQVMVLLDEYDNPILYSYEMGYYDEMITFMKQLFVSTFKDNSNLKKGIIMGITKVFAENLFSDANNINVYNLTDTRFSEYFGFTKEEVNDLLKEYHLSYMQSEVEKWYDGYLFSKTIIYNPWSILKFLENADHILEQYWVKTGGIGLLKNLIYNAQDKTNLLTEFESLIDKGYIEHVNIDLNMDLKTLQGDANTVWTLFLLTGYLTPITLVGNGEDITLKIPNLEVKKNLIDMATSWFKDDFRGNSMVKYLVNGEITDFKNELQNMVLETFSYLDVPSNSSSEGFYHAFTMGLLRIDNNYYDVTSNRESGYGRYDMLLKAKNNNNNIPSYIIEFKLVSDNSTFAKTLESAFEQIDKREYEVSLKGYNVIKMAIAFKGKKLELETR